MLHGSCPLYEMISAIAARLRPRRCRETHVFVTLKGGCSVLPLPRSNGPSLHIHSLPKPLMHVML
jgi:hypothetical protein